MSVEKLSRIAEACNAQLADTESTFTLPVLATTVDSLPAGFVDGAIKRYQGIIRNNQWAFPIIRDVNDNLPLFLGRWHLVHQKYIGTADEIFEYLTRGRPLQDLVSARFLHTVIVSETMRGWVGKRSPSGLDMLVREREGKLEALLEPLGEDTIEQVIAYGGIYANDRSKISAEREIVELFAAYHAQVGRELRFRDLADLNENALKLLRGFCRYSLVQFNTKYQSLAGVPRRSEYVVDIAELVNQPLLWLDPGQRVSAYRLLEELRILNLLNLNAEVKYSFKGWAGLMHFLYFQACSEVTGVETDVYEMLNKLKRGE